jgi:hypothetical protein
MLLLASSPLLFFFSRSAFLEAPLIFFIAAAALAVKSARLPQKWRSVLCGLLFVAAMLAKSSAIFLSPALLYLLWKRNRRREWQAIGVAISVAVLGYGLYWFFAIHTHQADLRTLYKENEPYLGWHSFEKLFRILYRSFRWIDFIFFPMACIAVLTSFVKRHSLWRNPLFGFAVLWYAGYSLFMILHFEASPHYFTVLVFPVILICVFFLQALESNYPRRAGVARAFALLAFLLNAGYIVKLMSHHDYTFLNACRGLREQIDAEPQSTRLVIGHGAMETTFYTKIPALDDIGSMPVSEKLAVFHPGWAVTFSDNDAIFHIPGLANRYTFAERASYPVYDQKNRDRVLLYRIKNK